MTITETNEIIAPRLGYGLSDADQHFYEAEDSVTRYLDQAYRGAFRWVEDKGRKMLMLNDKLYRLVPNPTYDPVAAPGSMVDYFKGNNAEGRSLKEIMGEQIALDPAFRYRESRMKVLDAQGVDLCIMLPTQVLGLEEMLWDDPGAMTACVHSLNRWIHEEWSWNIENRVLVTGAITLIDPDWAIQELERLIEQGVAVIGMRPAPIHTPAGYRSPGDPAYDPFWARAAEAGVVIGMHAADSSYGSYLEAWGESGRWLGHRSSPLGEIMGIHTERPIYDMMATLIAHGVFDRHPKLKVAALELGAGWVPELIRRLKISYGKTPQNFTKDPVETFIEHTWVMPFYEDDLRKLTKVYPIEKIIYGSDWPHPEGYADPQDYIDDLADFTPAEQRLIMRDNLRTLAFG